MKTLTMTMRGQTCVLTWIFIKQRNSSTNERAHDRPTSSSMLPFMEKLAFFLECPVKTYSSNKTQTEVLSLTVSAIGKLELLVNYFDKYPLIGDKVNDYKK
jgi:LAGLIDADG endonuclease